MTDHVLPEIYRRIKNGTLKVKKKGNQWGKSSSAVLRFWATVDADNGPIHPVHGRCWLWLGSRTSTGYGQIDSRDGMVNTHRFSYEIFNGDVPPGLHVLHRCDNRVCVNPNHLFLGTDDDNKKDMMSKGRQSKGENFPQSKLTDDIVREARRLHKQNPQWYTRKMLANRYGVSPSVMGSALRGASWKHVKDG